MYHRHRVKGCLRRWRGRGARMTGRQSHLNKLALRVAEGALSFGQRLSLNLGLGVGFLQKEKPPYRTGLLGGWLMGFEPTTLGTTNRCSNQLSYSHHVPSFGPRVVGRERKIFKMSQCQHLSIATSSPPLTHGGTAEDFAWRAGIPREVHPSLGTSSRGTWRPWRRHVRWKFGRPCRCKDRRAAW